MASKKIIIKLLFALSGCIMSINAFAAENYIPVSKFCLEPYKDAGSIFFNYDSEQHTITKGKAFEGVDDTNYKNCMTVTAEQQLDSKNHENINWIKQHMLQGLEWNGNAFGSSTNASKDTPNALNFAVLLDTINYMDDAGNTYICNNVIVAQGFNYWSGYNWWMVSNNTDIAHTLKCYDKNNKATYFKMFNGGNSYTIIIEPVTKGTVTPAAASRFW